jgi:hypothetical protein
MNSSMKSPKLLLFILLVIAGNYCMAQVGSKPPETTININSIMVGFKKHTAIKLSPIDAQTIDFVKADSCKIVSYKLTLKSPGKKLFCFHFSRLDTLISIQGDSLPTFTMKHLKSGDKLYIDKIQAKCGKGDVKTLKGVTIKVK